MSVPGFSSLDVLDFTPAGANFSPGSQRTNTNPSALVTGPDLVGVTEGFVDNSIATLDQIDSSPDFNMLSMGDGGRLDLTLTETLDTESAPVYLYLVDGFANEAITGEIAATAASVTPTGDLSTDFGAPGAEDDTSVPTESFDAPAASTAAVDLFEVVLMSEAFPELAGADVLDKISVTVNGVAATLLFDGAAASLDALSARPFGLAHPDLVANLPGIGPAADVLADVLAADAYSRAILVQAPVLAGANTLRVEVADVGDGLLDSAVALRPLGAYQPVDTAPQPEVAQSIFGVLAAEVDITEGDADAPGTIELSIMRTGGSEATSVDFAVYGRGANQADDTDFAESTVLDGTVDFAAGQTQAKATLVLLGDDLPEGDEAFAFSLLNPRTGILGPQSAINFTISDDDEVDTGDTGGSGDTGDPGDTGDTGDTGGGSGQPRVLHLAPSAVDFPDRAQLASDLAFGQLTLKAGFDFDPEKDVIVLDGFVGDASKRFARDGAFDQGTLVFESRSGDAKLEISGLTPEEAEAVNIQIGIVIGTEGGRKHSNWKGDQQIFALGGDDKAYGGIGNDWLFGGDGNDALNGQRGADRLFGDAGDDILKGNAGADILSGGSGDDILNGSDGDDVLAGDSGRNNRLDGGRGDDVAVFERPAEGPLTVIRRSEDLVRLVDDAGDTVFVFEDLGDTVLARGPRRVASYLENVEWVVFAEGAGTGDGSGALSFDRDAAVHLDDLFEASINMNDTFGWG